MPPDFRGAEILRGLPARYQALHVHILVAAGRVVGFFEWWGFARARETRAMWIDAGGEH